jgi:hypothetical protein
VGSPDGRSDSFQSPLARVLEMPHLAALVPHLAPETLHGLIRHTGLHACTELLAAATPEQLTSVFDLDLWRHARAGQDDQFDPDRFGEWLDVLMEAGPPVAARIVAAQDEQLVTAGLSRYIRVLDPASITPPTWSDDDEEPSDLEVTGGKGSDCEIGGYLVSAIRTDAWDAVVGLLLALEADHPARFNGLMRRCRLLSDSAPEVDGLDELLAAPEQLLHDVAADREQRLSQRGYTTPADARAFLQLARQPKSQRPEGTPAGNPIATAYFRQADVPPPSAARDAVSPAPEPAQTGGPEALAAVVDLLTEAGLVPDRPRALLEEPGSERSRLTCIRPAMEYIRDTDDEVYFRRSRELAFLANTLMAGCSVQSRPLTAQEASDAVVSTCNLALEHWPGRWPAARGAAAGSPVPATSIPADFLVRHDLVTAFEVGWAVLHQDVNVYVAKHLIVTLRGLRTSDAEIRAGLAELRRQLASECDRGTPWRARNALEVLALLDMTAWASLAGLLDECPVLPDALTATLSGRTGPVSATAFDFISTVGQIEGIRTYMGTLATVLRP